MATYRIFIHINNKDQFYNFLRDCEVSHELNEVDSDFYIVTTDTNLEEKLLKAIEGNIIVDYDIIQNHDVNPVCSCENCRVCYSDGTMEEDEN